MRVYSVPQTGYVSQKAVVTRFRGSDHSPQEDLVFRLLAFPEPQEPLAPKPTNVQRFLDSFRKLSAKEKLQMLPAGIWLVLNLPLMMLRQPPREAFEEDAAFDRRLAGGPGRKQVKDWMDNITRNAPPNARVTNLDRYFSGLQTLVAEKKIPPLSPVQLYDVTSQPELPKLSDTQQEAARLGVTPHTLYLATHYLDMALMNHVNHGFPSDTTKLTISTHPNAEPSKTVFATRKQQDWVPIRDDRTILDGKNDKLRLERVLDWIVEAGQYTPNLFDLGGAKSPLIERVEGDGPGRLTVHLKPRAPQSPPPIIMPG